MLNLTLFREIFYQSRIPQLISTIDFTMVQFNPAFCEFVGYSSGELEKLSVEEISHPDDMITDTRLFKELLDYQRNEYQFEKRYIHKSGEIKTGVLTVSRIKEKLTGEEFLLGQVLDITEKKQMENALKYREKKYRLLAEHSSDIIMLHKVDFTCLYSSPSVQTLLGYQPEEMIGKNPLEFIHPDDLIEIRKQQICAQVEEIKLITCRCRKKDGSFIWIESTVKALSDPETGEVKEIVTVTRDIEQRMETQDRLRKSEKLAVVGQMAAAVAHEIRNPLTPIKGFMQLLNAEKEMNPVYLKIVLDELHRVEVIISEFLTMAKPHTEKLTNVCIDQLVEQVVQLLKPDANLTSKELHFYVERSNLSIMGDPNSLTQVFLNIIQNALEATEKKGQVHIKVMPESTGVTIKINDNGCGIPRERLSKLGEPFYSTKERGTGLGLMTCYRIVEAHQGRINIESQEGNGTTVSIWLPCESINS
ncbi:PAS domain S-box protein [Neobacillus drentensis]|uniref:PAS domain-containing sensor histidine kinase n=1 Tax=Neobacillus drentensis TaxID=220684 RepID=UPI001F3767F8|nr:PAS domain-containing sensor histidine kinase [Neobacillus drentensis]ULT59115.1 PAS domain S-box protein [Neobacillus drentensis]